MSTACVNHRRCWDEGARTRHEYLRAVPSVRSPAHYEYSAIRKQCGRMTDTSGRHVARRYETNADDNYRSRRTETWVMRRRCDQMESSRRAGRCVEPVGAQGTSCCSFLQTPRDVVLAN